MSEIIPIDPLWFPPANIIYHGTKKLKAEADPDKRKLISESVSGAIMLVGVIKSAQEPFWLQPTNPREQTPDVRTMRLVSEHNKPAQMEVQEVEIVTLEENSPEEIDDFLKRTKLHPKKAYPMSTTILLCVNKSMRKNKSWRMIYESLKDVAMPNDVYILVRVDPVKQKYQLVKVRPDLTVIEFDVMDELQSRPPQKVMKPKRGYKNVTEVLGETHIPFEE